MIIHSTSNNTFFYYPLFKKKKNVPPSAIVVVQNATVLDLKKAICRFMELKQQREGGVKHISW